MNRSQHWGGRIAIGLASAAILGFMPPASPQPAATSTLPAQIAASLSAICSTTDEGRPDPPWMRESFENDNCSAPQEPSLPDGTKANRDQLIAGLAAAKKFAASAERYQQCISSYLTERMREAQRTGTPMKANILTIESRRIVASAASKKKVWDQITMAVDTFNAEGSECPE